MIDGDKYERPNLDEPLPENITMLLERGKAERTIILPGTE